jgi:putative redox protein
MGQDVKTATVSETGSSAFAVAIDVDGYHLIGDEPVDAGGGALGPSPYDLLLAALGECTAMTVRWYARRQNWPLDHVSVTLTHRKSEATDLPEAEGRSGKIDLFEKTVAITGAALTPEQIARLVDVASRCPVQRTLESAPVIRTLRG